MCDMVEPFNWMHYFLLCFFRNTARGKVLRMQILQGRFFQITDPLYWLLWETRWKRFPDKNTSSNTSERNTFIYLLILESHFSNSPNNVCRKELLEQKFNDAVCEKKICIMFYASSGKLVIIKTTSSPRCRSQNVTGSSLSWVRCETLTLCGFHASVNVLYWQNVWKTNLRESVWNMTWPKNPQK